MAHHEGVVASASGIGKPPLQRQHLQLQLQFLLSGQAFPPRPAEETVVLAPRLATTAKRIHVGLWLAAATALWGCDLRCPHCKGSTG